jgi:hypothetical protein
LLPRLGDAPRRNFVSTVLAAGSSGAVAALLNAVDEREIGAFDREELMASRLYKESRAAIAARNEADRRPVDLSAFGVLATAVAAKAIVEDLIAAGLTFADPSLALLWLNAALGGIKLQEVNI